MNSPGTSNDDILSSLINKMDRLEANNALLSSTNQDLLRRVKDLEDKLELVQAQSDDLEMKVGVLRDARLRNASQRVFSITELLERILLLCQAKQLFSLQNVSKTFRTAITGLLTLKTATFSNPKDARGPGQQMKLRRELQPSLQLNPFFAESWKTPTSDCSAITFQFQAAPSLNATYWIRSDLSATFSIWMGNPSELQAAVQSMQTPFGRTYLTLPALPTSVRVTFPDRHRPRARSNHRLTKKGSTHFREDVSAILEVGPLTVLDMMRIAETLERSYTCGEKVWVRSTGNNGWAPKSAIDEQRELFRAVQSRPSYSS